MNEVIEKLQDAQKEISFLLRVTNDLQKNQDPILKYLDKAALKADAVVKVEAAETLLGEVKAILQA